MDTAANTIQVQREGEFDFPQLKKGFERVVADTQTFIVQTQRNHDTRFALWAGQSSDGKKRAREGSNLQPVPWDGASDLRVMLVDEAISTKVDRVVTAGIRANIRAVPTNGYDIKRAALISSFMRWMVQTQIPDLERELELVAQYLYQDGLALTGQFWDIRQEKVLRRITLQEFEQAYPGISVDYIRENKDIRDGIVSVMEVMFGITPKKAKKALDCLLEDGECELEVMGKERGFPVLQALSVREDVYLPPYTTDLESCPEIHRVKYMTPEQIRSIGRSNKWDENWVEDVIDKGTAKTIGINDDSLRQIDRGPLIVSNNRYDELVGVIFSYRRMSDEDGVSGVYCTIWSPFAPPKDGRHDG